MERPVLLAGIALVIGLPCLALSLANLARAMRFRFQWGKPYVPGSIARATRAAFLALLIAGFGTGLALTRWLLRDYQPLDQPATVAEVRVLDGGSGYVLEMKTHPFDGDSRLLAVGLPGETWQIRGTVVRFPAWAEPIGLIDFQIVDAIAEPNGSVLSSLSDGEAAVVFLSRLPGWVGVGVEPVDLSGRGSLPEWTPVAVDAGGYFLALDIPSADSE